MEREKALRFYITSAVVIGKQVEKGTPTLESIMLDTFQLEKPKNHRVDPYQKTNNLTDNL